MSKPKPQFQPSNILLVEVPPQFIALCTNGAGLGKKS